MDKILIFFSSVITNYPFAGPLFAFLGGIFTSFSPCSLSSVPLIIGYIGKNESRNKTLKLALVFALGNSIIFVLLGILSSYANVLFRIVGSWVYLLLAFILILMVFEMWGVTHIVKVRQIKTPKKKGYIGAISTGMLSGIISSPCSTPILIVLLTLSTSRGTAVYGAVLLFYYALGHNVLAITSALASNKISRIKKNPKYKKYNNFLNIFLGLIILLIAFYFFYIGI